MSNNPFSHSHALHVIIPTTSAEAVPQTPAERTNFDNTTFANGDAADNRTRLDADVAQSHPTHIGHPSAVAAEHGHELARSSPTHSHALTAVPSTPVQPGTEGVPSTPVSPRASRRVTRAGTRFSVSEDHEDRRDHGHGHGDLISEAAMMLGVVTSHLIASYMESEEPSSQEHVHSGDEKEHQ